MCVGLCILVPSWRSSCAVLPARVRVVEDIILCKQFKDTFDLNKGTKD